MASKTRYPELMYRQAFPGVWRFVGDGCDIGPHYASKSELLADLDRFAAEYGCDGALDEASALRTRVARLEAEKDATVTALRVAKSEVADLRAALEKVRDYAAIEAADAMDCDGGDAHARAYHWLSETARAALKGG